MDIDRRYPRINLSCDIEYVIDNHLPEHEHKIENSKTKDISAGGMCFITYNQLPIGTILNLKFKLASEKQPFSVKGKIIWTVNFDIGGMKGWDNGIEFIDIQENDQQHLHKYLSSMI